MQKAITSIQMIRALFLTLVLLVCVQFSIAQPNLPQRTLSVQATQVLQFGTLAVSGAGGTVTVDPGGSTSSEGITLLASGSTPQPAIFLIKLCQGRNVSITFDPTAIFTSGPSPLTLDIGPTDRGGNNAVFYTNNDCNFITPLRVGGTLHVPGGAIPGTYTWSFNIIFNQE